MGEVGLARVALRGVIGEARRRDDVRPRTEQLEHRRVADAHTAARDDGDQPRAVGALLPLGPVVFGAARAQLVVPVVAVEVVAAAHVAAVAEGAARRQRGACAAARHASATCCGTAVLVALAAAAYDAGGGRCFAASIGAATNDMQCQTHTRHARSRAVFEVHHDIWALWNVSDCCLAAALGDDGRQRGLPLSVDAAHFGTRACGGMLVANLALQSAKFLKCLPLLGLLLEVRFHIFRAKRLFDAPPLEERRANLCE